MNMFKIIEFLPLLCLLLAARSHGAEEGLEDAATSVVIAAACMPTEAEASEETKTGQASAARQGGVLGAIKRATGYDYTIEDEERDYESALQGYSKLASEARRKFLNEKKQIFDASGLEPGTQNYFDAAGARARALEVYQLEIHKINGKEHTALKECGFGASKILEGFCETTATDIKRRAQSQRDLAEKNYQRAIEEINKIAERKAERCQDDIGSLEACHKEEVEQRKEAYKSSKERIGRRANDKITLNGVLDTTGKALDLAGKGIDAAAKYYKYQAMRQKAELDQMKIDHDCQLQKERFYMNLHRDYFRAALETCGGDAERARQIADTNLENYKRDHSSWSCVIM